jgi:RsiW-degrading membrane proteinase PrsW (M82 family)
MPGSLVLLVLILISAVPVIAVYIWYRLAKYQFSLIWFLFALFAGATAFFPALFLQNLLPLSISAGGRLDLFYRFFIRIASTEEISRLIMLFIFFFISGRLTKESSSSFGTRTLDTQTFGMEQFPSWDKVRKGAAGGLIAGLGFSILESARYAADDMSIYIILLRGIFTAALHGACGSRVGAASVIFRSNPLQAFMRLLIAIAIHGIYNYMVELHRGFPLLMAFLIAVSAAASSILTIRSKWNDEGTARPGS